MLRNIMASAINQRNSSIFQRIQRNFLTKKVENNEAITTFLTENKTMVDKEVFETFKQMVQNEKRVFLFKIHGFSNFFYYSQRFQIIGLTIGCIAHLGYFFNKKKEKLKEQTAENRDKRAKLYFVTGALIFFTIAGNIVTYLLSRRYLKSINYMPKTNQLEFNFYGLFCQDKPYLIELNQVVRLQKKLKDSTIQFQIANKNCPHTYFSSLGTGYWSNKKIFEYIVDENSIPQDKKIQKLQHNNRPPIE